MNMKKSPNFLLRGIKVKLIMVAKIELVAQQSITVQCAFYYPYKGRTVRKLMGGGGSGRSTKKYSRKGKLKEKKFMHAH